MKDNKENKKAIVEFKRGKDVKASSFLAVAIAFINAFTYFSIGIMRLSAGRDGGAVFIAGAVMLMALGIIAGAVIQKKNEQDKEEK